MKGRRRSAVRAAQRAASHFPSVDASSTQAEVVLSGDELLGGIMREVHRLTRRQGITVLGLVLLVLALVIAAVVALRLLRA